MTAATTSKQLAGHESSHRSDQTGTHTMSSVTRSEIKLHNVTVRITFKEQFVLWAYRLH